MKKGKTLKMELLKDLTLTFLLPFFGVLLTILFYTLISVEEETAAMQEAVISLDYTQAEPYLQKLLEKEGTDVWSHFLIANQYGTEQAHTEGKAGHGYSISREEAFSKPWKEEVTFQNYDFQGMEDFSEQLVKAKKDSKAIAGNSYVWNQAV